MKRAPLSFPPPVFSSTGLGFKSLLKPSLPSPHRSVLPFNGPDGRFPAACQETYFFQAGQKCLDARRPQAFHLPFRQAILRVASRRIRSDSLPRRRVGESAGGVLHCTLQQACPVLDTGKDEGNDADGRFSAACRANSDALLIPTH